MSPRLIQSISHNVRNREKKLKKLCTVGLLFLWRIVENWAIPEFILDKLFGGSLKMSTKYCVTKSKKKLPISLKYVQESCPFTPYIFIKIYTWSISFETIYWKLSISWNYSKTNLASSHNPINTLTRLFKKNCNKLF